MDIEDMLSFAKRKGFFWQSADIYGGASGLYDYGHLGALLKRRFEDLWLSYFVNSNEDYHLIEGSDILPEKPLVASGHAERFNDILVGCSKCGSFFRADVLLSHYKIAIDEGKSPEEIDDIIRESNSVCLHCKGRLMPSKPFNLMLSVALGPENKDKGYLRPETAQSVYLNFAQEFNVLRNRLPMGLAIIGKAYRNEISPRQGLYRLRELTQAELQIFFDPQEWNVDLKGIEDRKVNVMFAKAKEVESISARELAGRYGLPGFYISKMVAIKEFYTDVLKIPEARFRFLEKDETERAFYNKLHMDIEVDVESWGGFREVGGLHYRGDYDLTSHSNGSGHDLSVNVNGKRVMPNVLELSFGVDRNVWAIIDIFYRKDGERSVLQVPPYLAPYNAAVFPLQKDERIDEEADRIFNALRKRMLVVTDRSGSIGRRYARMDEIGTPYCITVDYDTVDERSEKHGTVTVRDRDSKAQERVKADEIEEFLSKRLR